LLLWRDFICDGVSSNPTTIQDRLKPHNEVSAVRSGKAVYIPLLPPDEATQTDVAA
jgi:hypothetical protein